MTANEIRLSFLKYFERNGHRIVPSSPLVPHEDPTLLFTNAGMNQFKDAFLGKEKREYSRATTAQKCMRVSGKHNDLDNVGPSFRHHTFFEMLGNFSFGDYFKRDAIPFAWKLLTEEWKLPPDRLWATIFQGDAATPRDDEAHGVWRKFLPVERIGELGAADNFWQMGDTGPCGRCSEIYYFRGPQIPCSEEAAGGACRGLECSCDRFVEIWNNVFMEFDRQAHGKLNPLPAPSIDTGMGLERVTAVLQGKLSNYDTDLFTPILERIGEMRGLVYGVSVVPPMPDVPFALRSIPPEARAEAINTSMRVIADHTRAMTFLIADGVIPSNEWRGYVLRKIMRRAMRHGNRIGFTEPFLYVLVDLVVDNFGDAYRELKVSREVIAQQVLAEEKRFQEVLTDGLPRLEEVLDKTAAGTKVFRGESAFRLYETFGLPLDFIEDMIEERKLSFDRDGFERAMEQQREKARAGSKFKGGAREEPSFVTLEGVKPTIFTGYESHETKTRVARILKSTDAGGEPHAEVAATSLAKREAGWIALDETPFYLQSGGQVSDVGTLENEFGFIATVSDVQLAPGGVRLHKVIVASGTIKEGDPVVARIDATRRAATRRNHTATHLLHAALRQVLGPHVKQAGSLVAPDRLRFDFAHFSALTREQLLNIEQIVNKHILKNTPVETVVKPTQEAIAGGAMALFGEKYGDTVRVVSVPGFSMELCGGTHVQATGDIGLFAIVSETGVAAGTRRIEAITGTESLKAFQSEREIVSSLAQALNAKPEELPTKIAALQDDTKRLARELQQARMKAAMGGGAGQQDDAIDVAGIKLVAREVSGLDKDGLRALVDQHRARIKSGVVVLASPSDGKVSIVVGVTPDLIKKIPAGQVVKQIAPIVGGGGGGRPDFAEAGGKDASKIGEMLEAARGVVEKLLSGGA